MAGRKFSGWLLPVLFWSVISAAFIGPGTVTTAASAGSQYGTHLLWALTFSTLACIILQEAAARLTIVSGQSLGENISIRFKDSAVRYFVAGAIIFGSAAYQAGNLIGAGIGLDLIFGGGTKIPVLIMGIAGSVVLWFGTTRGIAYLLSAVVVAMGFSFVYIAFQSGLSGQAMLRSAVVPSFPEGSGWLILGLVGTTIVPYNLFLGSGISYGQTVKKMRSGLIPAVLIGGMISMAILISATGIPGPFSFQTMKTVLATGQGLWAAALLSIGLFAAGFTSSLTAPLAAAITAKTVFGKEWTHRSPGFRWVWITVMFTGLFFGTLDIRPLPAIILAQALNGFILPFVSIFLVVALNRQYLKHRGKRNSAINNILLLLVLVVCLMLGIRNLFEVIEKLGGFSAGIYGIYLNVAISVLVTLWVVFTVYRDKNKVDP